ncbi:MAG: DEAD/DEAH box helicase [Oscillospiraceae bacterium]|nr:DEAD/DEAH box helicase [Oscillospiraceae bacterium]
MTFQELKLLPQLLDAVAEMGYTQPSPIQAQAIPPVLKGRDLIGCAQTGTGKTAAFAIPILQRLHGRVSKQHTPIRALVLTPTRELALQIKDSFDQYGKYLELRHTVIFGGVGQAPQVEALQKGVDILVATPGRLNDLCNQGHIDLGGIEAFVLDEADRMLDMGFIHDVRKVIARLPEKRQTLLFSATMPQEIAELSQKILRNPVRVEVTPQSSTVDAIEQRLYKVDKGNKKHLLRHVLEDQTLDSVLVFTNTKHGADRVVRELGRAGIPAMAIHGNKGQTARIRALDSFKSGAIRVLVATDIAARGIDVSELAAVVNYELPNVPETYVHRIGRTGRAGRGGVAVSFCNVDELAYLKDIEKLIKKRVPEVEEHPWPMEIFELTPKKQREPRPPRAQRQQAAPKPSAPALSGPEAVKPPRPVPPPGPGLKTPRPLPDPVRPAPRTAKSVKGARPAPRDEEPVIIKIEHPKATYPPVPPKPILRKITSDPPRMGRLAAFADGRGGGRNRRRGNAVKKSGKES